MVRSAAQDTYRGTEETGSIQPGKEIPFCEDITAIYTKVIRGYRREGEGCLLEVHGGSLRGKEHKSEHE